MVEELTKILKKLQSLFPQNVFILKTLIEYMTETSLSAEIIIYHRKLDELMRKK